LGWLPEASIFGERILGIGDRLAVFLKICVAEFFDLPTPR
jgi:hypothetical protein